MDVFGNALAAGGDVFRDAAVDAAYELDLIERPRVEGHRMRALVDVLVAMGVLVREGGQLVRGAVPPRPVVTRAGWGLMADVIRRDTPLPVAGGEIELRYHAHLATVGAPAAAELAGTFDGGTLLDLGAGSGTFAAAWLDAHPDATATVVDYPGVIALARTALARFGARVRFVAGDIRSAPVEPHDVVLLSNVLHLHDTTTCAILVAHAARLAKRSVVIKDLRVDDGRAGPFEGLAFALNMAVFTTGGDVYEPWQLRAWLGGLDVEERRLASQPDGIVMIGHRPRSARDVFERVSGTATGAGTGAMPAAFRTMFAAAIAHLGGDEAARLRTHYTETMPALRAEQLRHPLFVLSLDWSKLPRLARVLELVGAARAPTLGALYAATHYGGFMPLLYGYPADLAYFTSRGLDPHATIDRYLAAPILHELCHFERERDAILPPHLDECIAGWYGVHLWPNLAYPEGAHDDAIYAAPWLAQVGQAVARAYGADAIIAAHRGQEPWPQRFLAAATRFGWDDWCRRRTQHFLSDTFDPEPWLALVWRDIEAHADRAFDRVIVRDALRAMCLENSLVDGSFRARAALPAGPITIEGCRMTAPARGVDRVAPRYWLPPGLARVRRQLELTSLAQIDDVAEDLCASLRVTR